MGQACSLRISTDRPLAGSQTRMVLSHAHEARRPWALNARPMIASICPSRMPCGEPSEECQSRIVLSSDDVARVRPSGPKATALSPPVCPQSVARGRFSSLPVRGWPRRGAELLVVPVGHDLDLL